MLRRAFRRIATEQKLFNLFSAASEDDIQRFLLELVLTDIGFRAQAMVPVYLKGLDARCNQCDLFSAYRWTAKTIVWQETFTE